MPITFVVFGILLLVILFTNLIQFRSSLVKFIVSVFLIITLIGYLNFDYISNIDYSLNVVHLISCVLLLVCGLVSFKFNTINLIIFILEFLIFMLICGTMKFNITMLLTLYTFTNCLFLFLYYMICGIHGIYSYMIVSISFLFVLVLSCEYYELDFVMIDFNNLFYNLLVGNTVIICLWTVSMSCLNIRRVYGEKKNFGFDFINYLHNGF